MKIPFTDWYVETYSTKDMLGWKRSIVIVNPSKVKGRTIVFQMNWSGVPFPTKFGEVIIDRPIPEGYDYES